jgi:hypothetical protein
MRRLALLLALAVVLLLALSSPAAAVTLPPISTGLRVIIGPEGTIAPLGVIEAETRFPELVGRGCTADAEVLNNESQHPGTDVLITNGEQVIVIEDVEREADEQIDRPGLALVLARRVDVAVRLGPDGVFSGGLTVTITCPDEPPPTTTTTAAPTTTTAPPAPPPTKPAKPVPPPPTKPTPPPPPQQPAAAPVRPVTPRPVTTELPMTGSTEWVLAAIAVLLLGAGTVAVRAGRTERFRG